MIIEKIRQTIKYYITDHNQQIEYSLNASKSSALYMDSFQKTLESEVAPEVSQFLHLHSKAMQPVLTQIRNQNVSLRDVHTYKNLIHPNLERLTTSVDKQRLDYFEKLDPCWGYLPKFKEPNSSSLVALNEDLLPVNHVSFQIKKLLSYIDQDMFSIVRNLPNPTPDLLALTKFISENPATFKDLLYYGKPFVRDITKMPEFPEITERASILFKNMTCSEIYAVKNTFLTTRYYACETQLPGVSSLHEVGNTLIEQAILHPYLVSVLGHVLFLKVLYPLSTNWYDMSKKSDVRHANSYKESNFQKLIQASADKSLAQKSLQTLKKELTGPQCLSILLSGSATFSASSYIWSYYGPQLTTGVRNAVSARMLLESISNPDRFEGSLGVFMDGSRDLLGRGAAEAGMTLGRVVSSFYGGLASQNRPLLEAAADAIDKKTGTN